MTNQNPLDTLRRSVDHITPDVLERVLAMPVQRMERMDAITAQDLPEKQGQGVWFNAFAALAPLLLIVTLVTAGWWEFVRVVGVVDLDVNPSVEIRVNRLQWVVDLKAFNPEGEDIISGIGYQFVGLDHIVDAVLGSMYVHGYFSDPEAALLVSVEADDSKTAEELRAGLENEISELYMMDGRVVISQAIEDPDIIEKAERYGVSMGKMALIEEVRVLYPELSIRYLAGRSVGELLALTR